MLSNKTRCDKNYESQFVFIKTKQIHISDYKKLYANGKYKLSCKNGHELEYVNPDKRKSYFRHKSSKDTINNSMTQWHCEWQGNFKETEVDFKNEKQIKDRRADVVISDHNIVVEFQHSLIKQDEVDNRKNDYSVNGKKMIWVIHGDGDVIVHKLENTGRYFLEFFRNKWKFESFINFKFIFLDIDEMIYKIYPKNIRNDMIDVAKPTEKKKFIEFLNKNKKLIKKIGKTPNQAQLTVKQQGAGNGKTYQIIQNLVSEEFSHYTNIIIVTKLNSAKYVIYNEFKKQREDNKISELTEIEELERSKKYKISYKNKKGIKCNVIIGTIDSLMFVLGNPNSNDFDKFLGMVKSVVNGNISDNKIKTIKYPNNVDLIKTTCLICDETQDLPIDYGKAIIKIMRDTYIDTYVVGDKLQSLSYEDNAFTYLMNNDFPYITKVNPDPTNKCRRFTDNSLIDLVNNIVPFDKYNLPKIEQQTKNILSNKPYDIFYGKDFKPSDYQIINSETDKIMNLYIKEVNTNKCKPEDFLFVTPFTKNNILMNAVENEINIFWSKKNKDMKFNRYAVFHKSENGITIDLNESTNATRIVSIHSSKGDGRKVVFVIGMDEKSLCKFSGKKETLIYESLIHVALTRMKEKLYVRLIKNGDDFHNKIEAVAKNNNYEIISYDLDISKNVKYQNIIDSMKTQIGFNFINNLIIDKSDNKNIQFADESKNIIDDSHHKIRYIAMTIRLYLKIINKEKTHHDGQIKKQLLVIFNKIKSSEIQSTSEPKNYNKALSKNMEINKDKNNDKKQQIIWLLEINEKGEEYSKYLKIIKKYIKKIQSKITKTEIEELCPLESVIIFYCIQTLMKGQYSEITMAELYNIIHIYANNFNNNFRGHEGCLCKELFTNQKDTTNTILDHYEIMDNMNKVYDKFITKYPRYSWLINQYISFNGNNTDLKLYKTYNLIAYNDENIFIVYVKPQYNEINNNETLIDSIYDTFLLKNAKSLDKEGNNAIGNKRIKTIIFSLNNKTFKELDWKRNDDADVDLILINHNLLLQNIRDKITDIYKKNIQQIYSRSKSFFDKLNKENKLMGEKTIDDLKTHIVKIIIDKDKIPNFIHEAFGSFSAKCDEGDINKQNKSLTKYMKKEKKFLGLFEKYMIKCVDKYLNYKDPGLQTENFDNLNSEK